MSTYQRCPQEVIDLANEILIEFADHKPILDALVKVDFLFAFPTYDENGEPTGDAIRHHGYKALGLCRAIPMKDRAMGRGDAEILLDGDWWAQASHEERRALLDHEITHIQVQFERHGGVKFDDLKRPKIRMKAHDFQFGWFASVAARHGDMSLERIQARKMMSAAGQMFWPEILQGV